MEKQKLKRNLGYVLCLVRNNLLVADEYHQRTTESEGADQRQVLLVNPMTSSLSLSLPPFHVSSGVIAKWDNLS